MKLPFGLIPKIQTPDPTPTEGAGGWAVKHLPDVLREKAFLLQHWQWIGLTILILAGLVADRIVVHLLAAWFKKIQTKSKIELSQRFGRPFGVLVMGAIWALLLPLLDLPENAGPILTVAIRFLLFAGGVWTALQLSDLVSAYLMKYAQSTETKLDDLLVPLVRKTIKVIVIVFGVLFVADNTDIIDIRSLLAGLGLGGLAFALAAKDTLSNFFGSITVLFDRPFRIGDWVVIGDIEGTVEEVGFRSSRIRTFYNSLVTIPNSHLVNTAVDNLGARRYRRIKTMLSITYDTPPEKIEAFCEGVRELIRRHPHTRKDYFHVYFNQYANSSLDILLYCFLITPDWSMELAERHHLLVDILRLAHRLGVSFAFPTRTLHLDSTPESSAPASRSPLPVPQDIPSDVESAKAHSRKLAAELTNES